VVGVAAAITGAFGMNLVNHVEEHQRMFGNVCIALVLFMISLGYGILKKLSLDNII
jgi:Mg2+ and Co2+ transporter CorA